MGSLDYLADRTDARVVAALERTCSICKAAPGEDCRNPWQHSWERQRPLDRVVHLCRVQEWMDKR